MTDTSFRILSSKIMSSLLDEKSVAFDKSRSEYITTPNNANIIPDGSLFSISFWIKADTDATTSVTAVEFISDLWNTADASFMIRRPVGSDKIKIYYSSDGTNANSTFETTSNIFTGSWVHVVITKNGSTDKVYINGVDDTLTVTVGPISTMNLATTAYVLGANIAGSTPQLFFSGRISNFAIFPTALTQAQVTEISDSGSMISILNFSPTYWLTMGDGDTYPTLTDKSAVDYGSGTMTDMNLNSIVSDSPFTVPIIIYTSIATGTRIRSINVISEDSSNVVIALWWHDGTKNYLLSSHTITALAGTAGNVSENIIANQPFLNPNRKYLYIDSGTLRVSFTTTGTNNVSLTLIGYENP